MNNNTNTNTNQNNNVGVNSNPNNLTNGLSQDNLASSSEVSSTPNVASVPNTVEVPNVPNVTNIPNLGTTEKKEDVIDTKLSNEHVDLVKKDDGIKSFRVNPNVGFNIGKNLNNTEEVKKEEDNVVEDVPVDPIEAKAQKRRTIGVFVLFGIMFGVVFFLPQISLYFAHRRDAINQAPEITEGLLSCSYTDNSDSDETYSWDFSFKDNRATRANLITKTYAKADVLSKLETSCRKLQQTTSQYEGLKVECSYDNKTFVKKEFLNLQTIVVDQAYTAYTEAGGVYPNFYGGENIHDIEKDMNAKGFKCKKSK